MGAIHSWESPSSRLVLGAVLETLADLGYAGLTASEVRMRSGAAGRALGDCPDLDGLVIAALEQVHLFPAATPTGNLRRDLRLLLEPWRTSPSRDERVLAAVLSAACWNVRLRCAVHSDGPAHSVHTLCGVVRGLILDRLRSGPRLPVDLDRLVDFVVAGLQAPTSPSGPDPLPLPPTQPTATTA